LEAKLSFTGECGAMGVQMRLKETERGHEVCSVFAIHPAAGLFANAEKGEIRRIGWRRER